MGRLRVGRRGEEVARKYLRRRRYKVLEKNWGSKWGEIDLVMKKGSVVAFVEVKAKRGEFYGSPEKMFDKKKLEQVKRMGWVWCGRKGWEGAVRVDVVAVVFERESEKVKRVSHYKNVVEGDV